MAKGKKTRKMNPVRKYGKMALSVVRAIVLIAGGGHGLIRATAETVADRNVAIFPARITKHYTGYNPSDNTFSQAEAVQSFGTLIATVIAAVLIGFAGKRL